MVELLLFMNFVGDGIGYLKERYKNWKWNYKRLFS